MRKLDELRQDSCARDIHLDLEERIQRLEEGQNRLEERQNKTDEHVFRIREDTEQMRREFLDMEHRLLTHLRDNQQWTNAGVSMMVIVFFWLLWSIL